MIEPVAVIGGGRMGAGIAQVFAAAGCPVSVVDTGRATLRAAHERVARGLRIAADRGEIAEEPDRVLARIQLLPAVSEIPDRCALAIEAVPEHPGVKRDVLIAIEAAAAESCLIASNTSSLSIGGLAAALDRPGRFLGMHFFNPVPTSSLVEIIRGAETRGDTVRRAADWVRLIGKSAIVVRDSPGFASSRLGVLLGLEAIRMLEENVADAASIDRAMELGYRHPMGPLRSTDLVGLDVRLAVADYLTDQLGERFRPPKLLRDMVARGELGRKTGQGFYPWPAGSGGPADR